MGIASSIYLRVPAGFGDSLMATAVIAAIKREYPRLRIFVVTRKTDIFINNPKITACYHTKTMQKFNPSIYERCSVLEYVPYKQLRETKCKKNYIDFFYDCLPIPIRERTYQPEIYLTDQEKNFRFDKMQKLKRPLVAISPYGGATTRIPNKFYPVEKWPAVVRGLVDAGVTVIQFGVKKEGPVLEGALDFRNLGYRKTAGIIQHCDSLITHPSGFMHLATALGVPSITLFGGTEDPIVGGYTVNPSMTVDLDCAPCWLPKQCDNPKCKELLSPEKIVAKTLEISTAS